MTFSSGTGPKWLLSTAPAAGLSDSSHQPPPASPSPSTRRTARLISRKSARAGCQASTTWPGRIRRVRHAMSQSPGRNAGSMECSATSTRNNGQCLGYRCTFSFQPAE
jgi:hypothetical protein